MDRQSHDPAGDPVCAAGDTNPEDGAGDDSLAQEEDRVLLSALALDGEGEPCEEAVDVACVRAELLEVLRDETRVVPCAEEPPSRATAELCVPHADDKVQRHCTLNIFLSSLFGIIVILCKKS